MNNINNKKNTKYFCEEEIGKVLKLVINPFLETHIEKGFIEGENNQSIYYESYKVENPKANIVLCHGLTESIEKYKELIYYFLKDGFSVYAIEHRGHGKSGCLANLNIVDETQVNVEKFDYYVNDLKSFIDNIVMPSKGNKKLFLFAHSMGGARYMNYYNFLLENREYQKGGVSYNWLNTSFKAIKEIIDNAHKVKIPVMLCQAGKDTYVKPNGHNKFAQKVNNCELKIYKDSKHEIYWEKDYIMHPYLDDVFSFYNKNI